MASLNALRGRYASAERKTRGPRDKRNLEVAATIEKCFQQVIMTHLFPRSQFNINIHVTQEDGGVLPAAINATTLALVDAGIPLNDMLVACVSGASIGAVVLTVVVAVGVHAAHALVSWR